jgi:hypothetical protein
MRERVKHMPLWHSRAHSGHTTAPVGRRWAQVRHSNTPCAKRIGCRPVRANEQYSRAATALLEAAEKEAEEAEEAEEEAEWCCCLASKDADGCSLESGGAEAVGRAAGGGVSALQSLLGLEPQSQYAEAWKPLHKSKQGATISCETNTPNATHL